MLKIFLRLNVISFLNTDWQYISAKCNKYNLVFERRVAFVVNNAVKHFTAGPCAIIGDKRTVG